MTHALPAFSVPFEVDALQRVGRFGYVNRSQAERPEAGLRCDVTRLKKF